MDTVWNATMTFESIFDKWKIVQRIFLRLDKFINKIMLELNPLSRFPCGKDGYNNALLHFVVYNRWVLVNDVWRHTMAVWPRVILSCCSTSCGLIKLLLRLWCHCKGIHYYTSRYVSIMPITFKSVNFNKPRINEIQQN